MTAAVIGALRVTLGLNSAQFTSGLTAAQQQLSQASTRFAAIGKKMTSIGTGLSVGLTAPIVAFGIASSQAAIQAANAMAQVEAALKSTGNTAGFTGDQLADMAEGLMKSSLFDDDDIMQDVTAGMLRFGNISGEVFARAQQVAVDYAARTGKALDASTTLVGKALNDPAKAMGALSKAGITLSDSQQKALKSMLDVGNRAGAQAMILGLLEGKYAGAAQAAQDTDPYNKLADSLGTLQESFGAIVNRYLVPFMDKIAALADRFNGLSPAMQNFIVIGAGIAAAIGPILVAVGSVVSAIGGIAAALGAAARAAARAARRWARAVALAISSAIATFSRSRVSIFS